MMAMDMTGTVMMLMTVARTRITVVMLTSLHTFCRFSHHDDTTSMHDSSTCCSYCTTRIKTRTSGDDTDSNVDNVIMLV